MLHSCLELGKMRRLWLKNHPKRRPGQSSREGPGIRGASVTAAGIPGIPGPHFSPHPRLRWRLGSPEELVAKWAWAWPVHGGRQAL